MDGQATLIENMRRGAFLKLMVGFGLTLTAIVMYAVESRTVYRQFGGKVYEYTSDPQVAAMFVIFVLPIGLALLAWGYYQIRKVERIEEHKE